MDDLTEARIYKHIFTVYWNELKPVAAWMEVKLKTYGKGPEKHFDSLS